MATRFVATYECDASDNFKQAYINAKKEDVKIIKSPVGMPGRAIYNNFIKKTENEKKGKRISIPLINPLFTGFCTVMVKFSIFNTKTFYHIYFMHCGICFPFRLLLLFRLYIFYKSTLFIHTDKLVSLLHHSAATVRASFCRRLLP